MVTGPYTRLANGDMSGIRRSRYQIGAVLYGGRLSACALNKTERRHALLRLVACTLSPLARIT
jgi:hypothetical protein